MTHAKPFTLATAVAAGCLALATSLPAHAQSSGTTGGTGTTGTGMRPGATSMDGYSLLPYTRSGYVGLNLGKPDWRPGCSSRAFDCGDADVAMYLYTGGMINQIFGVELGYMNSGPASRNGGTTRAQGLNLSLVARMPVGAFNVFAKAGAVYGETKVTADPVARVSTGRERGWGGAYGVGVGYDFTPQMGVVLEWARNEFRFPGGGREGLHTVSLGVVRRF